MPERSFPSEDLREAQATACLKSAETHRALLLAVARKLAGSTDGGMELFQQTYLNCHDAIQRNGFNGDRYELYLLKSLRYLAYKEAVAQRCFESLSDWQLGAWQGFELNEEQCRPWAKVLTWGNGHVGAPLPELMTTDAEPAVDLSQLADQVQEEIRACFSPADRIALRLHVDGESYRDITVLVGGGDHTWISRRVKRMKETLREIFGQAHAALDK